MRGGGYYQAARGEDRLAKLTWSSVKRLIALAANHKAPLALAGLLSLLVSALTLANTAVIKFGVDRVQKSPSVPALDQAMLEVAAITIASALASFCNQVLLAATGSRILKEFREKLFAHLQRLPVSYFDKTRSGDLSSHLSNDVTLIQSTLTSDIANVAGWAATFLGGVGMLFWLDWKLTLVVVGLLVGMMLFFVIFGRMLRKLTRQMLDALSDVIGSMTEALANIRLVKAFAREPWEDERSSTRLAKVLELSIKSAKWESLMGVIAFSGFTLLTMGVLWYGGRNVIGGTLTLGTLVSFVFTVMFISGPMGQLASLYTRLQRSVGAAERLFTILDTSAETPDDADAVDFPMDNTEVVFNKVEFSYIPENPVLTGLNLTIPNGKVTALVGQSGGGKTTLSALLYRFYEPQNGSISINGIPIRKIKRLSLREHIGVVPQEAILFNGTIMENIRYGRLEATDEEIFDAAKAANVHEFVTDFAQGYETVVGERGITLSGGQRQRVAIARALLKDPKILILDEATSSLDTRSESLVREALERLMEGRTTLVIAHRLSTIQNAFQIAVLDDGRIMELGTHDELMKRGGRYAELQTAAQFDR